MNFTWLYIGALFAGAAALARRARIDIPWRVAAVFYLLVLAFLFKPMTQRYVNVPTDVLQLIAPWSADAPPGHSKFTVSNYEMQDVLFAMAPWAHQVRESWLALKPPLWNGAAGCGLPLMANGQSQALSPLRLLALPLPLGYSLTAEAAMKLLIALTFTFLYCRRRYDELPSVIGAIAFGFCTFLVVWLHFPHTTVAAFLPAVLYLIDLLAERVTFGRFVFAACLGPLILFGGHPETTTHIVVFAVLYAVWVIATEKRDVRFVAALAGACAVAALLSAPMLLPLVESMHETVSYAYLQTHAYAGGTAYSDFPSIVAHVQPRFYGTRPGPAWGPATAETICGFAGLLGVAAWFGLLARTIVRRSWRDRETFFLIATLLMFAVIDDWPLVSAPFRAVLSMALNSRFRLMFALLAAIQTAALMHHAKRERMPVFVAVGTGFALLAFLFFRTTFPSDEAKRIALLAMIPSAVVLVAAATRIRLLVAAAVFVELWITIQHWNPVRPVEEFFPRTPLIEALERLPARGTWRIAGIGGPLFPNTHAGFGVEDARVHDAMSSARYAEVLKSAMRYDPMEYYPKFSEPDAPILDALNIRWLLTEAGVDLADKARYRLVYDGRDGRIWENLRALPRFVGPNLHIKAASNDEYQLLVHAPHQTLVTSSIAWWPGWRVSWNGRDIPTRIVNGAFLGFDVPKGRGFVKVQYMPMSFWGGVALALITALVLGVRWRSHRFAIADRKAVASLPHS